PPLRSAAPAEQSRSTQPRPPAGPIRLSSLRKDCSGPGRESASESPLSPPAIQAEPTVPERSSTETYPPPPPASPKPPLERPSPQILRSIRPSSAATPQ